MLTIVIGICVLCGIVVLLANTNMRSMDVSILCFGLLLVVLFLGFNAPLSGYTEWKQQDEIELVSLSNSLASGGTGTIYVSLSSENVYTYRYEIESEFGTETSKEYETNTASDNVEEIEDPNCEIPVLRIYTRKGKMSIWTFALGNKETKYVFYVPEGTIAKEVKLN